MGDGVSTEPGLAARIEPDPWAPMEVLEVGSVQPRTIWPDSRPSWGAAAGTDPARTARR